MRYILENALVMKNMFDGAFDRFEISLHLACGELTRKNEGKGRH